MFEKLFSMFKSAPEVKPNYLDLTEAQRNLIRQVFPHCTNVNIKQYKDQYLFPDTVHGHYKRGGLVFKNVDGVLTATVGFYMSAADCGNPNKSPYAHFDEVVNTYESLKRLESIL